MLNWLDQYIAVDRLNLRPHQVFPRMRWWEWTWYIAILLAAVLLQPAFDRWQERVLSPIPYLRHVQFIVTWPVLGLLYGLGALLLPARQARDAAPGEAWLIGGIWAAAMLLGYVVNLDWLP